MVKKKKKEGGSEIKNKKKDESIAYLTGFVDFFQQQTRNTIIFNQMKTVYHFGK